MEAGRDLHTPEEQLVMDPKIDGLIEKLKRTCGPAYDETFRALLMRLKTSQSSIRPQAESDSPELLVELRLPESRF